MLDRTSPSVITIRDPETGKVLVVRGAGSMIGKELPLKKGIDLTKPIAEQALSDKRVSKR